jgi:hypothetical protein
MKPIRTFTVAPSLPPQLERQRTLIYDHYRVGQHDAIEFFRWDRELWEKAGHNPVLMLGRIEQGTSKAAPDETNRGGRIKRLPV